MCECYLILLEAIKIGNNLNINWKKNRGAILKISRSIERNIITVSQKFHIYCQIWNASDLNVRLRSKIFALNYQIQFFKCAVICMLMCDGMLIKHHSKWAVLNQRTFTSKKSVKLKPFNTICNNYQIQKSNRGYNAANNCFFIFLRYY